jgi:hypothetical protein
MSTGCEVSDWKRENDFIKPFEVLTDSLDFQGKTVYFFGLVTACQQSQGLKAWGFESGGDFFTLPECGPDPIGRSWKDVYSVPIIDEGRQVRAQGHNFP